MNKTKYRVGLPENTAPVELPPKQSDLINKIRKRIGKNAGCWDVLAWKGDEVLFIELKKAKKDSVKQSQIDWLEGCLNLGLTPDNFILVEWTLS